MLQQSSDLFQDPKLPHLGAATNPEIMAEMFAGKFRLTLAAQGLQVENCAIEWVQHRRGRRCRLLYRLDLREASGKKFEQWFFGRLVREGQAQRQYEQAPVSAPLPNGLWQPVNLWPELEMIVWAFPHDPEMPGLAKAVDPVFVQARIEANRQAWGLSAGWRCGKVAFERVKYMPGKRCVLRYEADLENQSGESRRLAFYSKTYSDGRSRSHYDNLQEIHARLGDKINIPRPLLHVEEANTFWQEPWEGRALIDLLDEWDWHELFPRLAKLLAAFHKSHYEGLPRVDVLERALDSAQEDAQVLGWLLPQYRSRCDEALAALVGSKEILAKRATPVAPFHGTFRIEQILARNDEIALVDFDGMALGDPLFDVAEFLTSLQYLEFSRGFARPRLAKASELFQESYEQETPWKLAPPRVAWYAVVSWLNKMHETLRRRDSGIIRKFDGIEGIMEEWIDGINELT